MDQHMPGSEDPKSFDERRSDSGELDREEEEKEEAGEEEEIVDQREGDIAKGEGLEEEIVRVEMEAKAPENGSGSADSVPGNVGIEDKEVTVVEEEKLTIPESGKSNQDASSALVGVPGDEIPKAVDYVRAETIGVGGASVEEFHKSVDGIPDDELVKEVVTLAQEVNPGAKSLVISDVVGSVMKNADSVSQISDDKEKFSSALEDRQLEKIDTQVISTDEDKSLDAPSVNISSGEGAVKALETGKQLEEQVVTTVANTSREVDNGKELETQKQSEEQLLIGSNPPPVRRTSWMGCCGLFEVFSGAR